MKLRALRYTLLLTALFGISFFLRASLPSPVTQLVSGSWVSGCTGATSTSPCKAQFNGNIQDITNPLAPFSVAGNNSLHQNMTDYGTPGTSDTLGITLWNGSGGIWFSTNWVGSPPKTMEQMLAGGNLVVH